MNSKSVQDKINGIGSWFTALPEKFMKMPTGKKTYAILWAITGIFLIATIAVAIDLSGLDASLVSPYNKNVIAGVSVAFVILLIISVFATVYVSYKEQKLKKESGKK